MSPSDHPRANLDRRDFLQLVGVLGQWVSVPLRLIPRRQGHLTRRTRLQSNPPSHTRRAPCACPTFRPAKCPPSSSGIDEHLQGFVTKGLDGALISPLNSLLHFPKLGTPA